MKKKIYLFLPIIAAIFSFPSCVNDEGNDVMAPINEIEISGIEEEYNVVTQQETLTITPEISGTISKADESDLEYEWFLCNDGITDHHHEIISTERNLSYPVVAPPSNYTLYFSVKDKVTGLKWEQACALNIISPFVRGFYLFGDKEDETVGLDFVSMINGRDNTVIPNILNNDLELRGAENIVFTGYYSIYPESNILWIITKSGSYKVENSASQTKFNLIKESGNPENFIFPTIPVTRPMKIIGVWPHSIGKNNTNLARTARVVCTENEYFNGSFYGTAEAYGNPINRYSASSKELFKPSKYVFYQGNSTYLSYMAFYDETNDCFVRLNSSYSFASSSVKQTNNGTPFYFDQKQYASPRKLIYGENGYGNNGQSYALMRDTDGNYYVYMFLVSSSISAKAERSIDLSIATDFAQADHYAFYSMQQIILYSVGSKLYAYDYSRHENKLIRDFGTEVTYIGMDYNSNNDPNHLLVATYGNGKGVVYGYSVTDNQNLIEAKPVEGEEWHTDLKVVKIEYRNAAN